MFPRFWTSVVVLAATRLHLPTISVLVRLSEEEFHAGLEALRHYTRSQPNQTPVVEDVDFFVFRRGESAI